MTHRPDADVIAGRYQLDVVIGNGAMAEVWRAKDLRLDRSVAVKLLHGTLAAQPEARLRFEEEARAAARLTDPNVVAIYDTGEHRGRPYIVMELLPGRTLRDEVGNGPLREERARAVIVDVLRALRAAHSAGVVHRDIKPANILLTPDGQAKVADFGIAKIAESSDLTATGLLVGTPSYLAPECVTGHSATIASDLYAVGVVLYELLSGSRPFAGATPIAVCHAIMSEEPTPLRELSPRVSAGVVTVVSTAMARDPESRYRSADEMIQAVQGEAVPVSASFDEPTQPFEPAPTLLSAMPTEVHAPTVASGATQVFDRPSPARPGSGMRARIVAAVVGIAVVLGGGAWFAVANHGHDASTKRPVVTTSPVRASTTATTLPSTTAQTPAPTPPTTPGKGHGPGGDHGKPPKPGND